MKSELKRKKRKNFKELSYFSLTYLIAQNMLYFFLKIHMEKQVNIGGQNAQQIVQNPVNQPSSIPEKPKVSYLLIGMILVYSVLVGYGGYYFGKQSSKNTTEPKQSQTPPSPSPNEKNGDINWKTYENIQYSLKFDYPQNYIVSTNSDCSGLINNQSACLLALGINPSDSGYSPKAYFWLLRGINSVNIPGQVSSINFNSQKERGFSINPFLQQKRCQFGSTQNQVKKLLSLQMAVVTVRLIITLFQITRMMKWQFFRYLNLTVCVATILLMTNLKKSIVTIFTSLLSTNITEGIQPPIHGYPITILVLYIQTLRT